jgi:CBS domain-containing protein
VLPSGPTTLDEMANAAFFTGLMMSLREEYGDIERRLAFDDARANLLAAARHGLDARFTWLDGESVIAPHLILERLLPLACAGLRRANVDTGDIERYLGVIEERVRSGQTGARWALQSLAAMEGRGTREAHYRTLARAMHARQQTGEPVHRWRIETGEAEDWSQGYRTVGQFMSTDLFTVRPEDLVDFAASVMTWRHIRHVPVEDGDGRLVGLISHRDLLRLLGYGHHERGGTVAVSEIMKTDPVTVAPDTPTLEAIEVMRRHKVGCLPVVERGTLVGIVTAQDFLDASARLFEQHLKDRDEPERESPQTHA